MKLENFGDLFDLNFTKFVKTNILSGS